MNTEKELTGYPSIDKPWLKYYDEETINAEIPECSIYEAIKSANEDNLPKVAIDFYGNLISYRELFENIHNVAASLTSLNIRKGDVVTICMLNTPETIYLLYAINSIGAIANILCPVAPRNELLRDINLCESSVLFTLDVFKDTIDDIVRETKIEKVIIADFENGNSSFDDRTYIKWNDFVAHKSNSYEISNDRNDVAVIVYTGGTTGGSKGVALTNYGIVATAWQYIHGVSDVNRNDTWAEVLPLFIAYGISMALQVPLMAGMTIILRLPMKDTLEELIALKPNHIVSVPNAWDCLAKNNKDIDLSFLIEPITGGDVLPVKIEEKINEYLSKQKCKYHIMNGYGMSEVCVSGACNGKKAHKTGTVGIPFVKNIVSAFDIETHEELKYGEEGELCICTPCVMKGYVNNTSETQNILRKHSDGRIWVHTGDLGFVDNEGFVHLCGRLKRYYVKYWREGVKKIFCPDAERNLITCPEIENSVIVPQYQGTVQFAHAFIIPNDKNKSDEEIIESIKIFCEKELGEVYRPDSYTIVDKFPRTKVGKIDYRALEKLAGEMEN